MNDAVQQIMNRAGCYACMPAAQLWALLAIGRANQAVLPASCFTLRCVDDASLHEVCAVLDQGQHTLEIEQAPGGSDPVDGITFTASDLSNHVLRLVLDQGFYTLDVVQSAGGSSPIGSLPIYCNDDNTSRTVTVILDQGFYTWNIA